MTQLGKSVEIPSSCFLASLFPVLPVTCWCWKNLSFQCWKIFYFSIDLGYYGDSKRMKTQNVKDRMRTKFFFVNILNELATGRYC